MTDLYQRHGSWIMEPSVLQKTNEDRENRGAAEGLFFNLVENKKVELQLFKKDPFGNLYF